MAVQINRNLNKTKLKDLIKVKGDEKFQKKVGKALEVLENLQEKRLLEIHLKKKITVSAGEHCETDSYGENIFLNLGEARNMRFLITDDNDKKTLQSLDKKYFVSVPLLHELGHVELLQAERHDYTPLDPNSGFPFVAERWVIIGGEDSPLSFSENTLRKILNLHLRVNHLVSDFNTEGDDPYETLSKSSFTRLHDAAKLGADGEIKKLIEKLDHRKTNVQDESRKIPLHHAAAVDYKSTQLLIEAGAQVNAEDDWGRTPLYYAIEANRPDIVKALLKAGASVSLSETFNQQTPLHFASKRSPQLVKLLLEYGASATLNNQDDRKKTALHLAVEENNYETVLMLLRLGAKNLPNNLDVTPFDFARTKGKTESFRAFQQYVFEMKRKHHDNNPK